MYDRERGELRSETVYGDRALRFFYGGPIGRFGTWLVFKRRYFSAFYGWLQRRRWGSRKRIDAFIATYGIDATECEKALSSYTTFDAFFTRRLRPDARPVDPSPEVVVFGAEGRVLVYPDLESDRVVPIKGRSFRVADLIGCEETARSYDGGTVVVIRLSPADYHRFHFPEAGRCSSVRRIGGMLHSVTPISLAAGSNVFGGNERHVASLSTDTVGEMLLVEVGAMLVGRIMQSYEAGVSVQRGQEKGWFAFGGSTVVYLFEPGRIRIDADLVEQSGYGRETLVRLGTRMGAVL